MGVCGVLVGSVNEMQMSYRRESVKECVCVVALSVFVHPQQTIEDRRDRTCEVIA